MKKIVVICIILIFSLSCRKNRHICEETSDCLLETAIEVTDLEKLAIGPPVQNIRFACQTDTIELKFYRDDTMLSTSITSCQCLKETKTIKYQVYSRKFIAKSHNLGLECYTAVVNSVRSQYVGIQFTDTIDIKKLRTDTMSVSSLDLYYILDINTKKPDFEVKKVRGIEYDQVFENFNITHKTNTKGCLYARAAGPISFLFKGKTYEKI